MSERGERGGLVAALFGLAIVNMAEQHHDIVGTFFGLAMMCIGGMIYLAGEARRG